VSKQIYLLIGKEIFLKKEFIQNLRKSLFPSSSDASFNYQEFETEKDSLGALIDFLQTAPFLAEKRMAVWWGIDEISDEQKEKLFLSLDAFAASAILVLISDQTNVKKDVFLKKLSEKAVVTPCHAPFEKDLPSWVHARVRKNKASIEPQGAPLLIERTGKDTASLSHAIEQLLVFIHPRTQILRKDIEALLGRSLEADVFGLVDLLIQKNTSAALKNVSALFKEGTRGYEIVAVLAGTFERLSRVSGLVKQGRSPEEIGQTLKAHPFYLEKILKQARMVSEGGLRKIVERLLECDETIKTSRLNDGLALERFVLEACA
jgi:DNA polymerase-3 subunit delta